MIRVLHVCHGNICRSPMAEFMMKDMVERMGVKDDFYIASAATSTEEIWNGCTFAPDDLKQLISDIEKLI